ncbi:hypothetical protein [Bacillus sp. CGMCC 1.16541]|uniref:hypothetical protein n=1 Tax=Bacillus sp. CGMCC 1.16541 TaxID=2185143 RepID=UPI00194EE203|nr:hypothetical protein [Bacillus sp. CGMCC 1.16541]
MGLSKSEQQQIIELAKQIIELDLKRDEKWETLSHIAGQHAHEILRRVQNGR